MKLLVIRHGESEADLLDVHEGRADFALTERGHRQAEAMANYVADNYNISKIYASTLTRAKQTAQHLSDKTGIPVVFDENLMEFNNGLLAGLPRAVVIEKYPEIPDLPIDKAVYGQESQVEFRQRAENALSRIINESENDETVAVVSHGGMINQLYRSFFNMPVDCICFFNTADTGIHIWSLTDKERRVIKANYDEHTKGI
ncbi:MAG: histidine phosphatase family protein [Clostridia bacterium]|nr:histidine phosphatase family protein [Clostridia bacterium]MBQ4338014.1 histidine phosphatase family protein [Clostridia bacterium]